MSLSGEWLLIAGILAFYVQDFLRLVYFDDLVVSGGGKGNWRVTIEASTELRGRFVWIPNPLSPARTALHASWLTKEEDRFDTPESLRRFSSVLWPIRLGCSLAGITVLVGIPGVLLTTGSPEWLLSCLATALLVTSAMVAYLAWRRTELGLQSPWLRRVTIECLLCPPYAVNLYRKVCEHRGFHGSPIRFAALHAPPAMRQALLTDIEKRIALFSLTSDDGLRSELVQALESARAALDTVPNTRA